MANASYTAYATLLAAIQAAVESAAGVPSGIVYRPLVADYDDVNAKTSVVIVPSQVRFLPLYPRDVERADGKTLRMVGEFEASLSLRVAANYPAVRELIEEAITAYFLSAPSPGIRIEKMPPAEVMGQAYLRECPLAVSMSSDMWEESGVLEAARYTSLALTATWPALTSQTVTLVNEIILELETPPAPAESTHIVADDVVSNVFYGTAPQPGAVDEAFVIDLATDLATTVRAQDITYNAPPGSYSWFVLPVDVAGDLSSEDFTDAETGDPADFSLITTITVLGVPSQVWRSNQPGLGPYEVVIS